jgi:hypothetical protein
MFDYLTEHPKYVWDYEKRVEQSFHDQGFNTNFLHEARWTDDDIFYARVTRLKFPRSEADSNVIQYEVTLRRGANDPKVLVDLLRRCKSVQEGSVGGNWTIHAWYRKEVDMWTTDAGNDGEAYYQTFGGFCESIGFHATPEQWNRIKQDRSRRMLRNHKELDMIQALKELKTFLETDYIRLGHPEDKDVIALKKAIDEVVDAREKGVWNDAVQTVIWVIESAINENETGWRRFVLSDQGWLRAVLGDHDDASFERARELCIYILTFLHTQDNQNRKGGGGSVSFKDTKKRTDQFCDGMDAQDKDRCGCILTARWKNSAKHIRHIIRRCMKLPLQEEGIQRLLGKIGLAVREDGCSGRWELAGPLYACYLETRKAKNDTGSLMRLCKMLWPYTKDGLRLDAETCTLFTTKYVMYYAVFRTIVSEVRQFVETYPLPETAETAGDEAEAPQVGAVRPHIIVFRLISNVSTQMLLGGMKELM